MWTTINYDSGRHVVDSGERLGDLPTGEGVLWLDLVAGGDRAAVEPLAALRQVHRLTLDDLVSERQRAKLEDYEDYLFLTLQMIQLDGQELVAEPIGVLLWRDMVLTVQVTPGDVFDPVRKRISTPKAPIRSRGADRLAIALVDAIIDGYFQVLSATGQAVEELEDRVVEPPDGELPELSELHGLRKRMLALRHAAWPVRELAVALERCDSPLLDDATRPYVRDLRDHAFYALEQIDRQRETLNSVHELYRSILGQRTNDVMRLLSVIATIFMPLTFLAGVYGMNFKHMPELGWAWGYPMIWAAMLAIAGTLLVAFGRRGWLS